MAKQHTVAPAGPPRVSRPKIQNLISKRSWASIKSNWLGHLPIFGDPGLPPAPGVEELPAWDQLALPVSPQNRQRYPDVQGLRQNALAEGVFLFHKCTHAHLATHRIGTTGMHSWSLFNAYHSAYLGARGILTLLGVSLPSVRGQLLIDIFDEPETQKMVNAIKEGRATFTEFLLVRFGNNFDQQEVWELLQRALRQTDAACLAVPWKDELLDISFDTNTKPRNAFLYHPAFWPLDDLLNDGAAADYLVLCGDDLDTTRKGFLMRLNFIVCRLFELLMDDLAGESNVIRDQVSPSRILRDPGHVTLASYNQFLADAIV